jgi:hypothetical protein
LSFFPSSKTFNVCPYNGKYIRFFIVKVDHQVKTFLFWNGLIRSKQETYFFLKYFYHFKMNQLAVPRSFNNFYRTQYGKKHFTAFSKFDLPTFPGFDYNTGDANFEVTHKGIHYS